MPIGSFAPVSGPPEGGPYFLGCLKAAPTFWAAWRRPLLSGPP